MKRGVPVSRVFRVHIGDFVPPKNSLLPVLILVIASFVLFAVPAYAMQELGDAEMSGISAGQYLVFSRSEAALEASRGIPSHDPPSMYLDTLTIGEVNKGPFSGAVMRSPQVTIKDMNGKLWVMEKTIFDGEEINLWLVVNVFKAPRLYFDTGLERYGWDIVDADYVIKLRNELNAMNLKGVDDKPLRVDNIVHQIAYNPMRREQLTLREPTYHADGSLHGYKSTYTVQECFYRRGYWIVFTY